MQSADKNFIVYKASAGSGKTFTLAIEYIILCLKSTRDFPFERILAITFTNKAANELKERILEYMSDLALWNADGGPNQMLLDLVVDRSGLPAEKVQQRALWIYERMLYNYSDIHVSTIDKFVIGILRSFSKELGLGSDFNVQLDQDEMVSIIRDNIVDRIGIDGQLTEQLIGFAISKSNDGKSWDIRRELDKFLKELLKEEGMKAMDALRDIPREKLIEFSEEIETEYRRIFDEIDRVQLESTAAIASLGIERVHLYKGVTGFTSLFYRDLPSNMKGSTPLQREYYPEGNWVSGKGKVVANEIESLKPQLIQALGQLNELIERVIIFSVMRQNLIALSLLGYLESNLKSIEDEDNLTLLATNNMRIASIVKDNPAPFIYERIGERFEHFLIDEFQDTSVQQWFNFLPLVANSLSTGKKNFVVGDAKQSIYRFRSGEVEQFANLPTIFEKGDDTQLPLIEQALKNQYEQVDLKKNYRSKNEVIEFNNMLYDFLSPQLDESFQKVYDAHQQETVSDDNTGGYVEVALFKEQDYKEVDGRFRAVALAHLLTQLTHCTADGYQGKDICILVRSNRDGQKIANFLREHAYQVVSSDSFFLGRNALCHLVVSMLMYLDDTDKVGPKLSILANLLHLSDRSSEFHSLAKEYIGSSSSKSKKLDFFPLFAALGIALQLKEYKELDLYATCEKIVRDLNLNSADAYLIELLHLCAEKGNRKSFSIRDFISYWETSGKNKSLILPEAEESIRIMTVHKSKGLEFPVVLIPFYTGKTDVSKNRLWVESGDERAPQILVNTNDLLQKTKFAKSLSYEKAKSDLDRLNLLYVASTRATDRLYINSDEKRLGARFNSFMEAHPSHVSDSIFRLGSGAKKKKQEEKKGEGRIVETEQKLDHYSMGDWRENLRVSLGKEQSFNEQMEFGTLVHDMLADLPIDESHDRLEEAKAVVKKVHELPELQVWKQKYDVKNEAQLLDSEGGTHRPDKVYLSGDGTEAIVLDYKTGAQHQSHGEQVKRYTDLLSVMGYQTVSGYLLYTEPLELKQVL